MVWPTDSERWGHKVRRLRRDASVVKRRPVGVGACFLMLWALKNLLQMQASARSNRFREGKKHHHVRFRLQAGPQREVGAAHHGRLCDRELRRGAFPLQGPVGFTLHSLGGVVVCDRVFVLRLPKRRSFKRLGLSVWGRAYHYTRLTPSTKRFAARVL